MADEKQEPKAKQVDKVYSKNYYLPSLMKSISGEKVTAEIDKELTDLLKSTGKKASDFHVSKEEYEKIVQISKLQIGITQVKKKIK